MDLKVILGGAGFSIAPAAILEYCSADFGVCGPGESALPALLDNLENNGPPENKLIDGWSSKINLSDRVVSRTDQIDYHAYLCQRLSSGF